MRGLRETHMHPCPPARVHCVCEFTGPKVGQTFVRSHIRDAKQAHGLAAHLRGDASPCVFTYDTPQPTAAWCPYITDGSALRIPPPKNNR